MASADDLWNWIYTATQELKGSAGQPWEARRQTFLEQLGISAADEHPVVGELLRQLDEMPDADRDTVVDSNQLDAMVYQLVQTHAEEPAGEGYDEAAWQTFLTTNGPAWNGSADSWPAFREWFEFHAGEQGLSVPAAGLLDHVAAMPVAERIAVFGQYGVIIGAAATEPADGQAATDVDLESMLDDLAALTEDIPGIEELSDEEITRIISEAINQAGK